MQKLTFALLSCFIVAVWSRHPPAYKPHHAGRPRPPSPPSPPTYQTSTCANYLCVDYVNDCGLRYGGCYYDCPGSTKPSFTDPGCPSTTSTPTTSITSISPSSLSASTCTQQLCVDYINSCGRLYGGCYYDCPGSTTPVFTDPGCPTISTTTTSLVLSPSASSSTCSNYLCADYINSCGRTYGGCYYDCPGSTKPVFTDPGCPSDGGSMMTTTAASTVTSSSTKITASTATASAPRGYGP